MSDVKQVKVDNWGIYFLQRLKHFFNRTDYCDLTLQFQDNAQLKVHRLVLSACTEYFELLERTCEMYEDCLVMPDDLQADVVVPIINFMYTGQLEFRMDLLERLYQTSQIMNMPVLTKLLEAHRQPPKITHSYAKRKAIDPNKHSHHSIASAQKNTIAATQNIILAPDNIVPTPSTSQKRSYSKAFDRSVHREKKVNLNIVNKPSSKNSAYRSSSPVQIDTKVYTKMSALGEPRPTRYELPEDLDTDNVFDNSFTSISYASQPLMVHPDTVKRYSAKRTGHFSGASSSKKFCGGTSTVDIVECKKITNNDNIFDDAVPEHSIIDECEMFPTHDLNVKEEPTKDPSQLFDQILDQSEGPKVTIDTKNNKSAANLDHAKIISEVLKKYPHLVKSNKNIKLKILNTQNKTKKQQVSPLRGETCPVKTEDETNFTYETDVIDSKQAAQLIAMGAENIKGPWICLICGTPGRALHFTSYYKFRRHLVEVHKEKPVSNICEYCGLKSLKRNYLLHHIYSKHGVPPPSPYHFPKCNICNYIALTESFLVKHKLSHIDCAFRCNVCASPFATSNQLLQHIQKTGHKYSAEKKNLLCVYCLKAFMRESNLFAHLKSYHKTEAKSDGIIEDSDEEKPQEEKPKQTNDCKIEVKYEPPNNFESEYEDMDVQYQIQSDGNIHVISKKQKSLVVHQAKQTILNSGFVKTKPLQKSKSVQNSQHIHNEFLQDININSSVRYKQNEEVVMIDNREYILRDNQLIPKKSKPSTNDDYILSDIMETDSEPSMQTVTPTTSMEFTNMHNTSLVDSVQQSSLMINKATNINQPVQFVVSNEEEYKALMSANHPIIFDNGDSNKTLTLLTAPHNTSLNTTAIDLDDTQQNDMMIIQENYPLNVTDTVATDNSNIVVVYSHPVDDQNKQFQLITTQGIGTQFVQSSAIITQNFETVTTSAPIMNAHVIDAQEVWQNEVQAIDSQEVQTTPATELQTITQTPQVEMVTQEMNENDNNLSDLPEVNLIPETPKEIPSQDSETVDTFNKPAEMTVEDVNENTEQEITVEDINENTEQEVAQVVESKESTSIDTDIPPEVMLDGGPTTQDVQNELVTEESTEVGSPDKNKKETAVDVPQTSDVVETHQDDHSIVEEETNVRVLSPTFTQDVESNVEDHDNSHEQSNVTEIISASADQGLAIETNEKIQHLTSEWSEDEYETQEPNDAVESTSKTIPQIDPLVTETPLEVEESIENIQQEVEKHISTVPHVETEAEENENLTQDDNATGIAESDQCQESVATMGNDDISQHKISSLLNEWEDNDSQEEASSNENDGKLQDISESTETIANTAVGVGVEDTDTQVPKTDDNIKSLVSDWDEDEEENKE